MALAALRSHGSCTAYNLGCGGIGYTVKEIIEAARAITGCDIPTRIAARRDGDPPTLVASSTSIQRELGWHPLRQLDDIVSSAWKWTVGRDSP